MPSEHGHYYIASRPLSELLMDLSEMMLAGVLSDDTYNRLVPYITKADNEYTERICRLQAAVIEQGWEIQRLRAQVFASPDAYTREELERCKHRSDEAVDRLRLNGDLVDLAGE